MTKRRLKMAGLPSHFSPHPFRMTIVTDLLEQNIPLEEAQQIAAHESPKTTKLDDRTNDQITLDEIERIAF